MYLGSYTKDQISRRIGRAIEDFYPVILTVDSKDRILTSEAVERIRNSRGYDINKFQQGSHLVVDYVYEGKHFPVIYGVSPIVYAPVEFLKPESDSEIEVNLISENNLINYLRLQYFSYDFSGYTEYFDRREFPNSVIFMKPHITSKFFQGKRSKMEEAEKIKIDISASVYSNVPIWEEGIDNPEDSIAIYVDYKVVALYNKKYNSLIATCAKEIFWTVIYPRIQNILKENPHKEGLPEKIEDYNLPLPLQWSEVKHKYYNLEYLRLEKRFSMPDEETINLLSGGIVSEEYLKSHKDDFVYSDLQEGWIEEEYAVWSYIYESYINSQEAVYSNYEDDYLYEEDDDVFYSGYYDDYYRESVVGKVYSETFDSYLPETEAYYCDCINDWLPEDEDCYCPEEDDDEDDDYRSEFVSDYHCSRKKKLISKQDSDIILGFELELHLKPGFHIPEVAQEIYEEFSDFISMEYDSSLTYGFECISDMFTPSFIDSEKLRDFMNYIESINTDEYDDAGLHIHFSFPNWNKKEVKYRLLLTVIQTFPLFKNIYRRSFNTYAKRPVLESVKDYIMDRAKSFDRHSALNIASNKGLELRLFKTATNYHDLKASLLLIVALAEYGKSNSTEYFPKFVKAKLPYIWDYLKEGNYIDLQNKKNYYVYNFLSEIDRKYRELRKEMIK